MICVRSCALYVYGCANPNIHMKVISNNPSVYFLICLDPPTKLSYHTSEILNSNK